MKQAHKKRSPRATANSPPILTDMGELFYKSGKSVDFFYPSISDTLFGTISVCHEINIYLLSVFATNLQDKRK